MCFMPHEDQLQLFSSNKNTELKSENLSKYTPLCGFIVSGISTAVAFVDTLHITNNYRTPNVNWNTRQL